jgi:hypothetical protein
MRPARRTAQDGLLEASILPLAALTPAAVPASLANPECPAEPIRVSTAAAPGSVRMVARTA